MKQGLAPRLCAWAHGTLQREGRRRAPLHVQTMHSCCARCSVLMLSRSRSSAPPPSSFAVSTLLRAAGTVLSALSPQQCRCICTLSTRQLCTEIRNIYHCAAGAVGELPALARGADTVGPHRSVSASTLEPNSQDAKRSKVTPSSPVRESWGGRRQLSLAPASAWLGWATHRVDLHDFSHDLLRLVYARCASQWHCHCHAPPGQAPATRRDDGLSAPSDRSIPSRLNSSASSSISSVPPPSSSMSCGVQRRGHEARKVSVAVPPAAVCRARARARALALALSLAAPAQPQSTV